MPKPGMKRPSREEVDKTYHKNKNDVQPVPEIQGKAKHGHEKAQPITK